MSAITLQFNHLLQQFLLSLNSTIIFGIGLNLAGRSYNKTN